MKVILSKVAEKHYKKLPQTEKIKVKRKLSLLETNPLLGKKLEAELQNSRSLKAWPYRIIYKIDFVKNLIEVSDILHRQGAYK